MRGKGDVLIPTKKGMSLTVGRWKLLVEVIEMSDSGLKNNSSQKMHLGDNVYASVRGGNPYIDIRQYWKPFNKDDIVPSKKVICLHSTEDKKLKTMFSVIGDSFPDMKVVAPYYLQSDHANIISYISCDVRSAIRTFASNGRKTETNENFSRTKLLSMSVPFISCIYEHFHGGLRQFSFIRVG